MFSRHCIRTTICDKQIDGCAAFAKIRCALSRPPMKTLYRLGLPLLIFVTLCSTTVCLAQQSLQPKESTPSRFSGATTNAKAVTWDDPVVLDGRILRLRDVWGIASALANNSGELSLRIPATQTPANFSPVPPLPTANQSCESPIGPVLNPACQQRQSGDPKSQSKPPLGL